MNDADDKVYDDTFYDSIHTVADIDDVAYLYELVAQISMVATLVLIVGGLLGNACTIVTFSSAKERRYSSVHYLIALAVADSGFLVALIGVWLKSVSVTWYETPPYCHVIRYTSYLFGFLSSWFRVALAVDRLIAVYAPLHCRTISTVRRARLIIVAISAVGILFNIWVPYGIAVTEVTGEENETTQKCDELFGDGHRSFYSMMNLIDMLLEFAIPTLVVLATSVAIIVKLLQMSKRRRTLSHVARQLPLKKRWSFAGRKTTLSVVSTPPSVQVAKRSLPSKQAAASPGPLRKNALVIVSAIEGAPLVELRQRMIASSQSAQEMRITRTLLVLSAVNVVLNVPSYVSRLVAQQQLLGARAQLIVTTIAYILFYAQYGVNVFLYSLSGRYRRVFRERVVLFARKLSGCRCLVRQRVL